MAKQIWVVADLGFGDAGKGSLVNYLTDTHKASLVVRYNGGSQCAHNVIHNGIHHTFAQIGSGLLANNRQVTYLSKYVLVNPLNLVKEATALSTKTGMQTQDILDQVIIDADALIITPYHIAWNRLEEILRGEGAHGSCGQGIGITRQLSIQNPDGVLRAIDLLNRRRGMEKLVYIQQQALAFLEHFKSRRNAAQLLKDNHIVEIEMSRITHSRPSEIISNLANCPILVSPEDYIDEEMNNHDNVIFEGAQGILLDEDSRFTPHVTWTNTTYKNAREIIGSMWNNSPHVHYLGVMRAYMTRHGHGPLPTEDSSLSYPEPYNGTGVYQGNFRLGYLDLDLIREALSYAHHTQQITLNHMDEIIRAGSCKVKTRHKVLEFNNLHEPYKQFRFIRFIEDSLDLPVTLVGFGPEAKDKTPWPSGLIERQEAMKKLASFNYETPRKI